MEHKDGMARVAHEAKNRDRSAAEAILAFIDRNARWLFPAPAVLVLTGLMVFPIGYNIYMSLHQWFASSVVGPRFVGVANFIEILTGDLSFREAVVRTLYFTVLCVGLQLFLGTAIALVLNREFAGQGAVRTLLMLPMIATPAAMALIWVMMYHPTLGVLNYLLSLIGIPPQVWLANPGLVIPALAIVDTWEYTPFVALILLAGLASAPIEPLECARIDGANWWQVVWHISLPLLRPAIVVAALFRTIDSLKMFDIIFVMTYGGPGRASETLNLLTYKTAFEYYQLGYASALSLALVVLVAGVSLALVALRKSQ